MFNKHLFIEDLLGGNGYIAQTDALSEIDNFLERGFVTEREAELEDSFAELCEDFEELENENAKQFLEIQELKKQIAELKGEKIAEHSFGILDKRVIFASI